MYYNSYKIVKTCKELHVEKAKIIITLYNLYKRLLQVLIITTDK